MGTKVHICNEAGLLAKGPGATSGPPKTSKSCVCLGLPRLPPIGGEGMYCPLSRCRLFWPVVVLHFWPFMHSPSSTHNEPGTLDGKPGESCLPLLGAYPTHLDQSTQAPDLQHTRATHHKAWDPTGPLRMDPYQGTGLQGAPLHTATATLAREQRDASSSQHCQLLLLPCTYSPSSIACEEGMGHQATLPHTTMGSFSFHVALLDSMHIAGTHCACCLSASRSLCPCLIGSKASS